MGALDWILSSTVLDGQKMVQPLPVALPRADHVMRTNAVETMYQKGISQNIMAVAPVGFSVPDPVTIHTVVPRTVVINGVPDIKESNAPFGGCI